jgi:hypothetical protein
MRSADINFRALSAKGFPGRKSKMLVKFTFRENGRMTKPRSM